jgi:hypothetical protein
VFLTIQWDSFSVDMNFISLAFEMIKKINAKIAKDARRSQRILVVLATVASLDSCLRRNDSVLRM